ncbi:MAG TPA: hypothetical protein VKV15_22995, partial [Bryobacteraceae bacterium]|nr:hypothetical protein [Bryobacteraceae bacterium]
MARSPGVTKSAATPLRCVRKILPFGLEAALGDLPHAGKSRLIPDDAIAWVQNCSCRKPKGLGHWHELWTYALLQQHIRKHCIEAGPPSLSGLSRRSRLHRTLTEGEIRPHKIRYYVERDPEFDRRRDEVLHIYKEVEIV